MEITHKFVSEKADGTDTTLVKPSNWNDPHDMVTSGDGVVLGVPAGAGAGPVQEIPIANMVQPGFIWAYAGATAPTGWLLCDGSAVNRTDWPALFAIVGTTYNTGGESGTQFRLPDLRGRVIVMVDGGAGRLPSWVLGTGGGESTHTLVSPEMPVHSHGVTDPQHQHTLPLGDLGLGGTGGGNVVQHGSNALVDFPSPTGISIQNAGGGGPHNNVQPALAMNYCIKT